MSTKETNRLRALAGRMSEESTSQRRPASQAPGRSAEVHAPHGERGDFIKVTATLSPQVYELVLDEMRRRKLARERDAGLSAILREAVVAYLGKGN